MPTSAEDLKQDLDGLTEPQLQQVADFIAFLKFSDRRRRQIILDPLQLAQLMPTFADEDRALAEEGMDDYAKLLEL